MDQNKIFELLTDKLGPLGPVIALAGVAMLLILAVLPILLRKQIDPLDKLRAAKGAEAAVAAAGAGGGAPAKGKPGKGLRYNAGTDKLDRFAGFLEPKSKDEMSESRKWLERAGYRGRNIVRTFHAIQFAMGLTLMFLGALYVVIHNSTNEEALPMTKMLVAILMPGVFGYYAPKRWVNQRVSARSQEIQNGFPDALDMLLVCVEAGQSLDQGIIRVSKELGTSYPAISQEFEVIAHEIKAGKDKATVLRAFGERAGVPDVQSFVTVMIQSQQFGTSIAEALRLYAADMRDKRIMRAEEAANKVPTKMTLGTMLFTVPPLLIILVGPSVHDMIENFKMIKIGP
ncbi:type II secretion system F family protein [Sinirhodobacter sp. WL0062]|uniref:Type II secretion system F family protein n=1 Tax=Rhodobacter flavimaris TaxID=2907145 RepID=A0ABS8YW12_9RHOB|nr:type II secretion system F family protein [Sinirhodobacter sp. WL0062]MCE5974024.1 type II secretion system F family protein [Sinirhodobacter sp. WL0062]